MMESISFPDINYVLSLAYDIPFNCPIFKNVDNNSLPVMHSVIINIKLVINLAMYEFLLSGIVCGSMIEGLPFSHGVS